MTKDFIFWLLMLLWLLAMLLFYWPLLEAGSYRWVPGSLLQFILFALLGYRVFGKPIKD
jgi:hypothetical protein